MYAIQLLCLSYEIRILTIAIFQLCLLSKMKLSVDLEGIQAIKYVLKKSISTHSALGLEVPLARSKIVHVRVKKIHLVNTYLNQVICGRGEPSTLHTNSTVLPSAADMHWTLSKTLGALESWPSLGSAKFVSKSLFLVQIRYLLNVIYCNVFLAMLSFATFCKECHDYVMDEAWDQSSVHIRSHWTRITY